MIKCFQIKFISYYNPNTHKKLQPTAKTFSKQQELLFYKSIKTNQIIVLTSEVNFYKILNFFSFYIIFVGLSLNEVFF